MNARIDKRCERAREYASLELDGELSQFELALLESHVEHCGGCRLFRGNLVAVSERLREAPLEQLARPIVLPRRQLVSFRSVQVGLAAALVIVAVGLGTLVGSVGRSSHQPSFGVTPASNAADVRELRDIRRLALQDAAGLVPTPGGLGLPTV